MIRVKWIKLTTDFSIEVIAKRLATRQYSSNESPVGFELLEVGKNYLSARFIRQTVEKLVETDPFGNAVTNIFTKYVCFEFALIGRRGEMILRVYNPPRSLKDFVAEFASSLENSITLEEIQLEVTAFIDFLKLSGFARRIRVRSAVFSEVPITSNSKGKVLVVSSADAIHDFEEKLGGGVLDKAMIELEKGGRMIGSVEFNVKGSVRISQEILLENINALDSYIAKSLEQR
jgi:hypothetical protein